MEISKISANYGLSNLSCRGKLGNPKVLKKMVISSSAIMAGVSATKLTSELDSMSAINRVQLYKNDNPYNFKLNLSSDELKMRTDTKHLLRKTMIESNHPAYENLADGDKEAVTHLVKAASVFDNIYMKQDSKYNLPFRDFLDSEIKKDNEDAKLTKILFDAQNGVSSLDRNVNMVNLAKGITMREGKAFYPEDLEKEEFHSILINMLKTGKRDEVEKILNQRTVVERSGEELKAVPYTEIFKKDFQFAADELDKAANLSTNDDFNEYLKLQAKALRTEDPMLDAYADKKWATLQDTPLEFTIIRESYEDEFTNSVLQNKELKDLLDKNGITPLSKDSLGARVGIVNKKSTESMLKVKDYLPLMAENMPFNDKYVQNISASKNSKQTMVDVDLIAMTGETGAYRAGITLAENLPNDDKLSIQKLDGGRRNVYHRQIRLTSGKNDSVQKQEKLNLILTRELHKYYDEDAMHNFTIGHENGHSLGPKTGTEALGKYKSIIEENKADMVSISMLDTLVDAGLYSEEEKNKILVTFAINSMLNAKPNMSQAHRVRSVMQNKFFIENGAMEISKDGKLNVNLEKMVPTARKMLEKIIEVQISGDFSKGEQYVMDNFIWTNDMQKMADNLKTVSKALNGKVESPLADKLLAE